MKQGFIQESQIVLREIPLHYLTALNSLNLLINIMNPHAHRERERFLLKLLLFIDVI